MVNVYIVSGPPGSGKSHQVKGFAAVMESEGEDGIIVSADHHWTPVPSGGISFKDVSDPDIISALKIYNFDVKELSVAHQVCMKTFVDALCAVDRVSNIIVDNTNIHSYEIAPYYLVGEAFDAKVEILRVETDVETCIERNIHGVPDDVIRRMHATFSELQDHPWEEGIQIPKQHMPWWVARTL